MPPLPSLARLVATTAACAGLLGGCGLLRTAAETPGRIANAVLPEKESEEPSPDLLQADLIRYSDLIVFRVDEGTHEFEALANSPEAELQASRWRLDALRVTTQITTASNAFSALLDLMVLATTMAWLQEDYTIPEVWGEAARPMHTALKAAEQDGWTLLEHHLPEKQLADARALIASWRVAHPKLEREALLEFPSFSVIAEKLSATEDKGATSLLGIVGLDPLSGLEPAARQVEQARQFGQRALFFAQRAPRLVGAEVEYRTLRARESKEVRQLLADTERITTSLESFGVTAAGLGETLGNEREAAVQQIDDALTAQRAGLVKDLEQSQAPLESLLRESRTTLAAGESTSLELANTLRAFDLVASRFDRPRDPAAAPPGPPRKPFDVADYGAAAERVGQAAIELRTLLDTFDRRLPEARSLLDSAAARGERTIDRALLRAGVVGLVLIAAAALATLGVRRGWRLRALPREPEPRSAVPPSARPSNLAGRADAG